MDQTYESGGVGAVNTKDLDGGLAFVGGRGKSAHGDRDEASGSGDAGGAENLAGEHGEEAERRNWQVFKMPGVERGRIYGRDGKGIGGLRAFGGCRGFSGNFGNLVPDQASTRVR